MAETRQASPSSVYEIPFADGRLRFELPAGLRATAVEQPRRALPEAWRAIRDALRAPLGAPPLGELARPGQRVCVVVTDATSACPERRLVPPIATALELAGVAKEDITILVGVGGRRASTPAEKEEKLGTDIVQRYKVIDHDARDPAWLTDLGEGPGGWPLVLNRRACEADLVVATGAVEPHPLAGYGGGASTLVLGCAGQATLDALEGQAWDGTSHAAQGAVRGATQDWIRVAARRARLRFVLNVVLDADYNVVAVAAGDPDAVHDRLTSAANELYRFPVAQQYDVAIVGLGWPKDVDLYQALEVVAGLQLGPATVVREGGVLIVPAPLPEGAGSGPSEERFYRALSEAASREALVADAPARGYPPGRQRASVVAEVLRRCTVVIVGARDADLVRRAHLVPAATMDEALALVAARCGAHAEMLVVPRATQTLPVATPMGGPERGRAR